MKGLLEIGWRPTPFRQFILKIHSRCNLACDYCYVYEMADQSWRRQPRRMARETIDAAALRIAEHVHDNGLSQVEVILHGGEPLLAGADHIRYAVTALRAAVDPAVDVSVLLQTNGVLLDTVFLDLFDALDVSVGVSVDGDAESHDRHRVRANGTGSYAAVRTGLEKLTSPRYRHLFNGVLSTIDLRGDPVTTYESLLQFAPPTMDFLLPHGNWDFPPPGLSPHGAATPYADWLVALFDRWYGARKQETHVRLFSEIIRMLLGQASRTEAIGLSPVTVVVVETDGSLEQVDSLKAAYEGAADTAMHVARDAFDAALLHPAIAARQLGSRALSAECTGCDVKRICGGGLYPHRYRSGRGFLNASVYCRDLFRLITHIHRTLANDVAMLRKGS
ncbi:FxsB family cyclophane-forming radical SAM/SPASM peptide maturase [Nonomuraea thailandensis]